MGDVIEEIEQGRGLRLCITNLAKVLALKSSVDYKTARKLLEEFIRAQFGVVE